MMQRLTQRLRQQSEPGEGPAQRQRKADQAHAEPCHLFEPRRIDAVGREEQIQSTQ